MNSTADSPVVNDPWESLRRFTDARIGRGRCGVSMPLSEVLSFQLDHARARDAVWTPFDAEGIIAELTEALSAGEAGKALADRNTPCILLESRAADRQEYLMRPDKGRRLSAESRRRLNEYADSRGIDTETGKGGADICIVVSDGLSARAAHENAVPFVLRYLESCAAAGYIAAPVCIVKFGRVAVADEVASLLGARFVVDLLGERPGLSSPNSLGVYMTYAPTVGTTDESRNCISNVRPAGLPVEEGVRKLCYLTEGAFARHLSGVELKDDMPEHYLPFSGEKARLQAGVS